MPLDDGPDQYDTPKKPEPAKTEIGQMLEALGRMAVPTTAFSDAVFDKFFVGKKARQILVSLDSPATAFEKLRAFLEDAKRMQDMAPDFFEVRPEWSDLKVIAKEIKDHPLYQATQSELDMRLYEDLVRVTMKVAAARILFVAESGNIQLPNLLELKAGFTPTLMRPKTGVFEKPAPVFGG